VKLNGGIEGLGADLVVGQCMLRHVDSWLQSTIVAFGGRAGSCEVELLEKNTASDSLMIGWERRGRSRGV